MISASELGKRFGSRWLFRNLEFDLNPGECLVVTGRNGSGKSTLLRVLADLERPSAGAVTRNIPNFTTGLGFSALDQSLFPNLTCREQLMLAADMRGIDHRAEQIAERVGFTDHLDVQYQFLSSGLRSRLKIAIAIQPEPSILIWDEPGVALDEAGRQLVESVLTEQLTRGVAIIATNDPTERRFGTYALDL